VGDEAGVFGAYAGFYDVLYAEKDYPAEVAFLEAVFAEHGVPAGGRVLDLGCGTGSHDILLAGRGYRVVGVDRSPEMVERAQRKAREAGVALDVRVGDVRSAVVEGGFDAVISMFAVVSYQTTDAGLAATFATARRHLECGGVFVFDVWHGPAVLAQRPEERTLALVAPDGDIVTRAAHPTLDEAAHTVEVSYVVTRVRGVVVVERAQESHVVRYLFADEIADLLAAAGFELVVLGPFMDLSRAVTAEDWNISVVARAV
jgi:SAM-dependent methyltransferase